MSEQLTGRELDAAVAEKVMGWKYFTRISDGLAFPFDVSPIGDREQFDHEIHLIPEGGWRPATSDDPKGDLSRWDSIELPKFSGYIEDAWQVVERLAGLGYLLTVGAGEDKRNCMIYRCPDGVTPVFVANVFATASPEAICRAALAAIGEQA